MHPQVRVKAPEWEPFGRIRVDREMAPPLRELWRRGYLTVMSCQDYGDGTAWIVFGTEGLARRFCYEAVGMADRLPDGWRTGAAGWPWPDGEPMHAVWFPRKHLAAFNARRQRVAR